MIPRRLHYVWVGSPLPDKQRAFIETWRQTNPDYELIQWDETNIDFSAPLIKTAYNKRQWSKVADIARLAAVAAQGGIYLDTDFKVFKSLDALLQYSCFYGFQHESHPTDWVANGAFGAEPGHWFIRHALARLLTMRSNWYGLERPTAFGPKHVTKLLREQGLSNYSPQGTFVKDIFVCPTTVFYPFGMDEEFTLECIQDDTVAAHFWDRSWDKQGPALLRVARLVRSRFRKLNGRPPRPPMQPSRHEYY